MRRVGKPVNAGVLAVVTGPQVVVTEGTVGVTVPENVSLNASSRTRP